MLGFRKQQEIVAAIVRSESGQKSGASIDQLKLRNIATLSGGCINEVFRVDIEGADLGFDRVLIKTNKGCSEDFFQAEADGLTRLSLVNEIRVPQIIAIGREFLVIEFISTNSNGNQNVFEEEFGRRLAGMHRNSISDCFGLDIDNFLGSSPQLNSPSKDWAGFWCQCRLGFQMRSAIDKGYGGNEFKNLAERTLKTVQKWIGSHKPEPALIHGDLWSGNFFRDKQEKPVLIDPAVYFADREAEFGMTTLFGGLGPRFYSAYREAWPLPEGSDERIEVYRLYHLLNHLNLFGSGYLSQCLAIMRKYG